MLHSAPSATCVGRTPTGPCRDNRSEGAQRQENEARRGAFQLFPQGTSRKPEDVHGGRVDLGPSCRGETVIPAPQDFGGAPPAPCSAGEHPKAASYFCLSDLAKSAPESANLHVQA